VIIASCCLVIKAINRMKKKEEAAPRRWRRFRADVKLLANSRPAQEPIDFGPSSACPDLDANGIRIAIPCRRSIAAGRVCVLPPRCRVGLGHRFFNGLFKN